MKLKRLLIGNIIATLGIGLCACGSQQEATIASEETGITDEAIDEENFVDKTEVIEESNESTCTIILLDQYPDRIYERYDEEYVKAYEPILRKACEIFSNADQTPSWGGELSVDYPFAGGNEDIFKCIGFSIQDFSGDGIPELYIGQTYEPGNDEMITSEFLDCLYTLKDGKPVMTTYGSGRIVYEYLGDNQFFLSASGGACNQQYGLYTLSSDGIEMICDACYVSDCDEVYFNTTGDESDRDKFVNKTELDEFMEKYEQPVEVRLTPFYDLVEFQL